jgi:hypothetical protein
MGYVYQEVTPKFWLSAPVFLRVLRATLTLTMSSCVTTHKPGERIVRTYEETKGKYTCTPYRKTILQLEDIRILPDIVTPGKEINQKIRYAFCSLTPSSTLKGSITRTVLFKGKQMFRDTTNCEFKPATWTIDVFIGIPKEAVSGVYALDVTLRYENQTLKKSNSFIVKSR